MKEIEKIGLVFGIAEGKSDVGFEPAKGVPGGKPVFVLVKGLGKDDVGFGKGIGGVGEPEFAVAGKAWLL